MTQFVVKRMEVICYLSLTMWLRCTRTRVWPVSVSRRLSDPSGARRDNRRVSADNELLEHSVVLKIGLSMLHNSAASH